MLDCPVRVYICLSYSHSDTHTHTHTLSLSLSQQASLSQNALFELWSFSLLHTFSHSISAFLLAIFTRPIFLVLSHSLTLSCPHFLFAHLSQSLSMSLDPDFLIIILSLLTFLVLRISFLILNLFTFSLSLLA